MTDQIPQNQIPTVPITDLEVEQIARVLRDDQNITAGLLGGLIAAVIGAILWAGISVLTKYQIGFMAIGVGFLVGFTVQKLGKGIDPAFGIMGCLCALLGCFLGNFFTICSFIAIQDGISVFTVFSDMKMAVAFLMMATFGITDIIFYAIAGYEGYKLALIRG